MASDFHLVEIGEGDRQMILMALAHLSLKRPGFDYALNDIASQIDNVVDGRSQLYDKFRELETQDA